MIYKFDWSANNAGYQSDGDRERNTLHDAVAAAKKSATGELQDGGMAYINVIAKRNRFDADVEGILVYVAYTDNGRSWHRIYLDWFGAPVYTVSEARQILAARGKAFKHN